MQKVRIGLVGLPKKWYDTRMPAGKEGNAVFLLAFYAFMKEQNENE